MRKIGKDENYNGKLIKYYRQIKEMSQEELSFRTGIDASSIGKLERNEAHPTLATLVRIAEALDFNIKELVETKSSDSIEDDRDLLRIKRAFSLLAPEHRRFAADTICAMANFLALGPEAEE